jgi:hypothetical protein
LRYASHVFMANCNNLLSAGGMAQYALQGTSPFGSFIYTRARQFDVTSGRSKR